MAWPARHVNTDQSTTTIHTHTHTHTYEHTTSPLFGTHPRKSPERDQCVEMYHLTLILGDHFFHQNQC